jgi:hypothetical protein
MAALRTEYAFYTGKEVGRIVEAKGLAADVATEYAPGPLLY